MELKKLDLSKGTFEGASGKKFVIQSSLSIERFIVFEKLQNYVGFGIAFEDIFNRISDAYELLNKMRPADCAVILKNIKEGVVRNQQQKTHPLLELCALFINYEDEDITKFEPEKIKAKIDDWKEYDMNGFFQLAFNCVRNLVPIYNETSQSILQEAKGKKAQNQTLDEGK